MLTECGQQGSDILIRHRGWSDVVAGRTSRIAVDVRTLRIKIGGVYLLLLLLLCWKLWSWI